MLVVLLQVRQNVWPQYKPVKLITATTNHVSDCESGQAKERKNVLCFTIFYEIFGFLVWHSNALKLEENIIGKKMVQQYVYL